MPENSRDAEMWGFTEDESKLWPSTYTVSAIFTVQQRMISIWKLRSSNPDRKTILIQN